MGIKKKGFLITLEGGEGSGKSTIGKKLFQEVKPLVSNLSYFREPGGTRIGEKIRKILKDSGNIKMSAKTEALLFQASRAQLVEEKLLPVLAKGGVCILDRFGDSSIAYQGYMRGLGRKTVEGLNRFSTKGLIPNLTIFFDVDPKTGLERKGEVVDKDRLDSLNLSFHKKVRQAYLSMIKLDKTGRWETVNANNKLSDVLTETKKIVKERLINAGFLERKNLGFGRED